ncbi:MAG TPA: response regulator transcription factor, partial [Candidatus Saccharimonas sp.]|nr:response regulator transcription factor [Candidatus Saccharimonas sp.]
MKVLVVDDERRIANSVKQGLEQEGYAVDVAYDGEDGYNTATNDDYDIVILDVMMPGLDGLAVAEKLRADGKKMPILMLTAKDRPRDIVSGLDSGADDYLAKPFSFDVLAARIRALLRRPSDTTTNTLSVDDVVLDVAARTVTRSGVEINLSKKEFA